MKRCSKCRRMKTRFHHDVTKKDGLSTWCADCVSKKTAAWAKKNRARKNATDRRWKRKNRKKDRARSVVRRAVEKKLLDVQKRCHCCQHRAPLEAHHVDYNHPLLVIWLCKSCHAARHKWGRKRADDR